MFQALKNLCFWVIYAFCLFLTQTYVHTDEVILTEVFQNEQGLSILQP